MRKKYPHFYDEEGNYIIGSKENQIERFKEYLRDTDKNVIKYLSGKWNHTEEEYQQHEFDRDKTRVDIRELEAWNPEDDKPLKSNN